MPGGEQQPVGRRAGRGRERRGSLVQAYALGAALVLFFVSWAAIAARPWQERAAQRSDPRVLALTARENELRGKAAAVKERLGRQWLVYQRNLSVRRLEITAARQRHEQELEAAVAAAAAAVRAASAARQPAVQSTATSKPVKSVQTVATTSSPPAPPPPSSPPPPPPPPTVRVVELPPEVQIVELPPITTSSSS